MPSADWTAPTATGAVDARVVLPGSKSLTNRYLVLAALAWAAKSLAAARHQAFTASCSPSCPVTRSVRIRSAIVLSPTLRGRSPA